jgi:hypothetical protein
MCPTAARSVVGGNVRTALVDDADDAERHSHALDKQPIRPRPLRDHSANGIGQRDDILDALRHRLDTFVVEQEAIDHGAGQVALLSGPHVLGVRCENRRAIVAQRPGRGAQGGVFRGGRRLGERARRDDRGASQVVHEAGNIGNFIGCGVHSFILGNQKRQCHELLGQPGR